MTFGKPCSSESINVVRSRLYFTIIVGDWFNITKRDFWVKSLPTVDITYLIPYLIVIGDQSKKIFMLGYPLLLCLCFVE